MANDQAQDPMGFVRNMWGSMGFSLPGMVTPTFDVDELEKRITDLKAVEGWLRMNLSMLQMTIQGLEMQKATLTAVQTMGKMAGQPPTQATEATATDGATVGETLSQAALWPWNLMQQMQDQLQQNANTAAEAASGQDAPQQAKPTPGKPKKA